MSNDEYKASLVNYSRFYFGQSTINNNNNECQAVFDAKLSDKHSVASLTATLSSRKPTYRTDGVNDNKNNNYKYNNISSYNTDKKFVPMNLITNTGLDLSYSTRKPTFATYFNNEPSNHLKTNPFALSSPCSSTSPSIDVENDDNEDSAERTMSPVSIPLHHQKSFLNETRNHPRQSAFTNMELTASSIPSGYPLNYHQYANNAALYGAPVMFSGAIHASYMAGLPLHASLSPNETYIKAIQAAACGIYNPAALAPPPPPHQLSTSTSASVNPSLIASKLSSLRSPTVSTMMALAPCSQPVAISKPPQQLQQQYSLKVVNNLSDIEQQQQKRKDYPTTPLSTQAALRTSVSSNSIATGTYLNDKVNESLTGVHATKDSHFKVPNGKEGSLKHRILRPASSSDVAAPTEQNKTPVMRNYSTTSNYKKGNYIELANGALRRIEDMRTEDFIQCAERSPHHQLAESTVVKINTSLPATAVITFSYDRNRSKVDMEVSLDHPFFVYGQGWASCNPEMSIKMFGLKCQRLQVGDICISVTKREQHRQQTPPVSHAAQNNSQVKEVISYQARHLAGSSPNTNSAHLKSPSLPAISSSMDTSYASTLNAHTFSMPVPQTTHHHTNHHLQQSQQQQHQIHQQTYAEMAKLMSSYAYAKNVPQLPHDQLQNLSPKMMSAFYQNQIFQFSQHQKHLRHPSYSVTSSLNNSSISPQPCDLENNHIQQQPPQTQPLDVTMSRKRRWSAPENIFDDDESETQSTRNGSSPATART